MSPAWGTGDMDVTSSEAVVVTWVSSVPGPVSAPGTSLHAPRCPGPGRSSWANPSSRSRFNARRQERRLVPAALAMAVMLAEQTHSGGWACERITMRVASSALVSWPITPRCRRACRQLATSRGRSLMAASCRAVWGFQGLKGTEASPLDISVGSVLLMGRAGLVFRPPRVPSGGPVFCATSESPFGSTSSALAASTPF